MPSYERRLSLPVSARRLYDWHAADGALPRLLPPWDRPARVERSGSLADARVVMHMRVGPLCMRWVAQHHDHVEGVQFMDRALSSPFAAWDHLHRFEPDGPSASTLVDRVDYDLPFGALGNAVGGPFVRGVLERMFRFRHQRTAEDLMRHAERPPLRIAITGASGLVGNELRAFLSGGGHTVLSLVRRAPGPGEVRWDPLGGSVDTAALEGVDAVVHLAGESVGERWSAERKRAIRESREVGTRTLAAALARMDRKPRVLISASAIGWYGADRGDDELDEGSSGGSDFLAEVCKAWEAATQPAEDAGIRVVHARVGVVLAASGGALQRMLTPARLGALGPIGSGRQQMSWIALDDVVGAIHHLLYADDMRGAVNLTAPAPVAQADFARTLGRVLSRPAIAPLPAFVVKTLFGEMGQTVLLGGQRVLPTRLSGSGFTFLRPTLEDALRFELGRTSSP
jgi:uncharacterized protein (TIGR01777 family)